MGAISTNIVNYKSAATLIAQIKQDLSAYDEMGLIDDLFILSRIKYIINKLGITAFQEYDTVIDIENSKGVLPANFSSLYAAYICEDTSVDKAVVIPTGVQALYIGDPCRDCKDIIIESKVVHHVAIPPTTVRVRQGGLLKVVNTSRDICNGCNGLNAKSKGEISISGGRIMTNFDRGKIYIQYYGFPHDEDNIPTIPDVPTIENAIISFVKYKLMEHWWLNGEVKDIERRVQYFENQFNDEYRTATYYAKTPTFARMVEFARQNNSRFSIFEL